MKLYLHCGLVVIHSNRLSDKGQGQKVQEKGETGQDKTQGTVGQRLKKRSRIQRKGLLARSRRLTCAQKIKEDSS